MIYAIVSILIFIVGYCFGVRAGQGKPITFKKVKLTHKPLIVISNEERERGEIFRDKVKQRELEQTLWTGDAKQEI
jgi:hypothetical protein